MLVFVLVWGLRLVSVLVLVFSEGIRIQHSISASWRMCAVFVYLVWSYGKLRVTANFNPLVIGRQRTPLRSRKLEPGPQLRRLLPLTESSTGWILRDQLNHKVVWAIYHILSNPIIIPTWYMDHKPIKGRVSLRE